MVDVRSPAKRAQQCMACHVGNSEQGKVVTHEMYAAGHPPLPGVELETFASYMPPHWRHVSAKLADSSKEHGEENAQFAFYDKYIEANPSATAGGEYYRSRSALISAIVAMQASLQLVGAQVEDNQRVPDFAAFDCYACHHDLKTPAWRQQRKDVGVPGRPHPAVWPTTLVDAAFAFAEVDAAPYEAALGSYHAAFDAQPFGDVKQLQAARKALDGQLAALLKALDAAPSDKAAVERAFAKLAAPDEGATFDYDAARQTAWALQVLAGDLDVKLPPKFGAELHLVLPAGQEKQIIDDLPARMKALSEYDPQAFRAQLEALAK